MPNGAGRDYFIWRGETDRSVKQNEADLLTLFKWRDRHEDETAKYRESVARWQGTIETKVALMSALGAVIGGGVVAAITQLFK